MNEIIYISPSTFYYWEKCPLQAVLSKLPESRNFFPNNPDADLGSLIHKFYEKQNEWKIDSLERFNLKWSHEIIEMNKYYKENELQSIYFPIQWYASYYTVKKMLLCNNLINKPIHFNTNSSEFKYLYEQWINNDVVGGRVDLLVKENGVVRQVVGFKTGKIFEKLGKTIKLKEVYKQQLALYASVILENQNYMPELYIEQISGRRFKVDIDSNYIQDLKKRAIDLKNKINYTIQNNTFENLSVCNTENCEYCFYRHNCDMYKNTFMNKRIGLRIDLIGKISNVKSDIITLISGSGNFKIKNVRKVCKYKVNYDCEVYNLFFPENNDNIVFETTSTVIKYE